LPALLAVLDAVADGRLAVLASVLPWLGIVSAVAVTTPEVLHRLRASGNTWLGWLRPAPARPARGLRRWVTFRAWE